MKTVFEEVKRVKEIPKVAVPMESLAEVIGLQLANGGKANLTVTGSSMMPLFYHLRDCVSLVPAEGKQKSGEIILYRRTNGQYVLHRIIRAERDHYVCCGDNQYEKEVVTQDQLIGVVDGFARRGKTYRCTHTGYRIYQALWVGLFPLRRGYIAVRRRLGRLRQKLRT